MSQRVTIESLPDDVLLDIFYFNLVFHDEWSRTSDWETLVHVCRRWRYVIFGSPIRLDLQLYCSERKPVRKSLDIWPKFPLVLRFYPKSQLVNYKDSFDNLIAALERRDRIREIDITNLMNFPWRKLVMALEEPLPALRYLNLDSSVAELRLPDTFLNGSAPCLQHLTLRQISFPSLPRLLSSTSALTDLNLYNIPNLGYISPETMAGCLSALPKLKFLSIRFSFPTPLPKRRNRPAPPLTRFILPALTWLEFKGVSEYLEALTARIDAPLLDSFQITFFHQDVFDIPQIIRFFGDSKPFMSSSLALNLGSQVYIIFSSSTYRYWWQIFGDRLDWQVLCLTQIFSQILLFRSSVDSLTIERSSNLRTPDNIDPTLWLQLFRSFHSVQRLTIPVALEPSIAAALEGLTGESAAEVFPSLHSFSIIGNKSDEVTHQAIQSFIAARQHSGHTVTLSREVRAS